jgi:hypothetical protein
MISNEEVRLAEWVIERACQERTFCYDCPHYDNCAMSGDDEEGYPNDWDIPSPPPEPTERQRIEWLRMLPDNEMMIAMDNNIKNGDCNNCEHYFGCSGDSVGKPCNNGHMDWWHEVVSLEQFRKDVGME